jgi:hypothetical protein
MTQMLAVKTKGFGLDSGSAAIASIRISAGASIEASHMKTSLDAIVESFRHRSGGQQLSAPRSDQLEGKPVDEQLYESLAQAKVLTAQVAMHLERSWRSRLFKQLDDLLNPEDWHGGDIPIEAGSFATFLRMIIHVAPKRRPGLGISNEGNLIAAWTSGSDRLTLEFRPHDGVRWMVTCDVDGERERAAGDTSVARLPEVLASYRPDRWFENGDPTTAD